jgi:outer membrane protein OmpA-like peptidoglycan-associated protein
MKDLEVEKVDLQGKLQSALSQVADTRESARGLIVSLPDILFDVGQATLKPDATIALAKLAGILLIMDDLNLRIEGHTDSTGSPSFNLRLSQRRADAVFDLLSSQGIRSSRIRTVGYGVERPVADNSSAEGRSRNRRVEIIIAEGEIAAG